MMRSSKGYKTCKSLLEAISLFLLESWRIFLRAAEISTASASTAELDSAA
jgi:hypothetical protein